jgi:hypothetical protein
MAERGERMLDRRSHISAYAQAAKGWTGIRWSELPALGPRSLLDGGMLDVDRKLYELSKFYLGRWREGTAREVVTALAPRNSRPRMA